MKSKVSRFDIIVKSDRTPSGWELLYGHCCYTKEDMEEYINALDSNSFRIVKLTFNYNTYKGD